MKNKLLILILLILLGPNRVLSQINLSSNQEKITKAISNYFELDRENIHLQLNKSSYLTNEEIWIKGYIVEKKNSKPFYKTSNVYVSLLDENGTVIENELFLAENSTFQGYFKLKDTLKSGIYFIRVYTYFMNNFIEDESSLFEIAILNPIENTFFEEHKIDYNSATLTFFPESGVFLEGTSNTIALYASDCNNNGISIQNGEIQDSKGTTITNFSTNEMGFGKFDLWQTNNETYKAVFEMDGKKNEKLLPSPDLNGITFSVNNYASPSKTIVKIKTNENTLKEIGDQPYLIAIQHNESISFIDLSFKDKSKEQIVAISNNEIADGINTLYLVDKNLKKMGERVLYNPPLEVKKLEVTVSKSNDSIIVNGSSHLLNGELSIAVLPSKTICDHASKSIYSSLILDSYLSKKIKNSNYFINGFNKRKQFELDNVLITENSKYDWDDMLNKIPEKKYEFDQGLTIKGTINTDDSDKNGYKINMKSLLRGIDENTFSNEKNEFFYKNVMAIDSTNLFFSVFNKREKQLDLKTVCQLMDNKRVFIKPFSIEKKCNTILFQKNNTSDFQFPKIKGQIVLDTINVKIQYKRPQTETQFRYNNSMSRRYKIDDVSRTMYADILQFIQSNGYDVHVTGGRVTIVSRVFTSFRGSRSPRIFIDDALLDDFDLLYNYRMETIDEIYINKRGFGEGSNGSNGVIRIYTKKIFGNESIPIKIKSQPFVIKNGFQNFKKYKNPRYISYQDEGFTTYGTIHWEPVINSDEKGNFRFSFPDLHQSQIKLVVEGISSNGETLSDTKIIDIP